MGSISGSVVAACKKCSCIFTHYVGNWLFIDEEVTGTCSNCFEKISHKCIDELQLNADNSFVVVGRKDFRGETPIHISQ